METTEDSEDEDILKVFRKQKVDGAVNEAFSRVLSMANSPEARQQYHRVLKRYCQTKVSSLQEMNQIFSVSLHKLG